ncbi:MAG: acyltransferase [Bacteroidaceae bacterium]|nr:acyltransferase [Bacteroidaceae bacterium]
MKIGFKSAKGIYRKLMFILSNLPMPGHWRWKLVKQGGVKILDKPFDERRFIFIGENVVFDSQHPEDIEIGNFVHITTGCVLLTHYMNTKLNEIHWEHGKIRIEDHVFLGAKTIISKPVTIGKGSIVGAGSVVTKDIPPYQIWAGNPARYIKDRVIKE